MSASTVISEGFGSFGNNNFVVTQGFGDYGGVTPPAVEVASGGPRKKRQIRITHSAYMRQQENEAAVRAAALLALESIPLSRITDTGAVESGDELEDDEILLLALTRLLH